MIHHDTDRAAGPISNFGRLAYTVVSWALCVSCHDGEHAKCSPVATPFATRPCPSFATPGDAGSSSGRLETADSGFSAVSGSDSVDAGDSAVSMNVLNAVWAVNDGEKIERDDVDNENEDSNSAWKNGVVHVFGGRNEVVAFQLIVESGASGIDSLRVSLPELVDDSGDAIRYSAPDDDPTDYVGRPIQIFSEHYLDVTSPTNADWITTPGTASSPKDMQGSKPVALVPENAISGRGGFPLHVAPRNNQAIWFDVYTGRDLPAGTYRGAIRVEADGEVHEVPIELELFDFTLPDANSWNAMAYFEPEQVVQYQGTDLENRYHRFAHRHRVEFVHEYDVATATAALGRFTGSDFTAGARYEGPGEHVGNVVLPRTMYGPGTAFGDRASAWAESDAWMGFLEASVGRYVTFLYMPDEPSSQQDFDQILTIADNLHTNTGVGRSLPIFVTHGFSSRLESAIDIWCTVANQYSTARATLEREEGDDMWFYNGHRPNVGSLLVDSPATDPRVQAWASFKHHVPTYFYWHADHWHHNHSAPEGYDRDQNIWVNPITFHNSSSYANGDGVLVFPGQEIVHPDQDRGIAGPIGTIQLANLRRGAQDHLYLTMLQQRGNHDAVTRALETIVPRVLDEGSSDDPVSFPENGNAFETVRYELARALAGQQQN